MENKTGCVRCNAHEEIIEELKNQHTAYVLLRGGNDWHYPGSCITCKLIAKAEGK